MPDPTGCCECIGVERAFCCVGTCPGLRRCCAESGKVRVASKVGWYGPLASCDVCSLGELPCADDPSLTPLSPLGPAAAAAAARSFFEAFPRFFRSRAYSQLSPNSIKGQREAQNTLDLADNYQCNERTGAVRRIWYATGYTDRKLC